jgi:hypothetical protein
MSTEKVRLLIQRMLQTLLAICAVIREILCRMLDILAESADTESDDAVSSAVRGGALNYRTGKLDDGTDAAGWYEKD